VARGQFRADLYSHIVQHPIQLMPLRSRPMDIDSAARLMLEDLAHELGRSRLTLAPRTLALLERHSFPSNLLELRQILTQAVKLSAADCIEPECLPSGLRIEQQAVPGGASPSLPPDSRQQRQALLFELLSKSPIKMRDVERCAIEAALRRTGDNVTQAMRELGIGRTTLYRKLKKYGRR
jgi:DNA-binding NtrC family response regulator